VDFGREGCGIEHKQWKRQPQQGEEYRFDRKKITDSANHCGGGQGRFRSEEL